MAKRRSKKSAQLRREHRTETVECPIHGDSVALLPSLACPSCSMERELPDMLRGPASERGSRKIPGSDNLRFMDENGWD